MLKELVELARPEEAGKGDLFSRGASDWMGPPIVITEIRRRARSHR
jgi:hypothetical protein